MNKTFFKVEFYLNTEGGWGASFAMDGNVLSDMEDKDLAAECQDAALRTRVIIEDLFAGPDALLEQVMKSDRFVEAPTLEEALSTAKGGH